MQRFLLLRVYQHYLSVCAQEHAITRLYLDLPLLVVDPGISSGLPSGMRSWRPWFLGLALVAAAHVNCKATVKAYFQGRTGLDQALGPWKKGEYPFEPVLYKAGVLRPVRLRVEPHLSFFFDPMDVVPVTILRTGEWQPEVWQSLHSSLNDGSVFLDVGTHVGYFNMKAVAKVGDSGRGLAFEPNPETLKLLNDNVAANAASNVTVEPIACTEKEQKLTFYAAAVRNTGMSSLSRKNAGIAGAAPPETYTVQGRPIDDVVRELNLTRVDAIKLDVEGEEVMGLCREVEREKQKLDIEEIPDELASFQTSMNDLEVPVQGRDTPTPEGSSRTVT